jgi:hypothetical protein
MRDIRANHIERDDGPAGHKVRPKESIETPKCSFPPQISTSGSTLVLEETPDSICQW